jgi:hypothetical protein
MHLPPSPSQTITAPPPDAPHDNRMRITLRE